MDKKGKKSIIIGIIALSLISLTLVGLTYAYYRTRIIGNKNSNSIGVTAKKLELVYGDNRAEIIQGTESLIPSKDITSSGAIGTKTFTVTNNGSDSSYVVVIDNVSTKIAGTNTPTEFVTNDFRYTLSCVVKDKSGTLLNGETCNKVESLEVFPIKGGMLVNNNIPENRIHEYTLTLWYIDTGLDQSEDMGKTYQARVNISENAEAFNPILADNIINNAKNQKNGTTFANSPLTPPAEKVSLETESVLSVAEDDDGPSYYFRGNVKDNYVNFAGMCWRIVRIAGDGSIKLILEDQYTTCNDTETTNSTAVYTGNWTIGYGNYGYEKITVTPSYGSTYTINHMNYLKPVINADKSMVKAFYDFQTTKLKDYTDKLKSGDWCLGDVAYSSTGTTPSVEYTLADMTQIQKIQKDGGYIHYDSYVRLGGHNKDGYQPTFKCNGTTLNEFADVSGVSSKAPMYVSALTADELTYAGGKFRESKNDFYLINDYAEIEEEYWWSLSPAGTSYGTNDASDVFYIDGTLFDIDYVHYNYGFRPAVSLATNTTITGGEGTQIKPYIIG